MKNPYEEDVIKIADEIGYEIKLVLKETAV
jgi:hypothetical protein